jgi:hypothetical protein
VVRARDIVAAVPAFAAETARAKPSAMRRRHGDENSKNVIISEGTIYLAPDMLFHRD